MKRFTPLLLLFILLLAACGVPTTGGVTAVPPAPTDAPTTAATAPADAPADVPTDAPAAENAPVGPLPAEVEAVVALYAESQGVAPDSLQVVSYEAVEFPDGCLGAATPGEMCTAMITPGYKIVVESNGTQTTIHSNLEGTFFRVP